MPMTNGRFQAITKPLIELRGGELRTPVRTTALQYRQVLFQEAQMAQQEPCAHPGCSCSVPPGGEFGKYCSEHCKKAKGMTELRCGCHHPDCK